MSQEIAALEAVRGAAEAEAEREQAVAEARVQMLTEQADVLKTEQKQAADNLATWIERATRSPRLS